MTGPSHEQTLEMMQLFAKRSCRTSRARTSTRRRRRPLTRDARMGARRAASRPSAKALGEPGLELAERPDPPDRRRHADLRLSPGRGAAGLRRRADSPAARRASRSRPARWAKGATQNALADLGYPALTERRPTLLGGAFLIMQRVGRPADGEVSIGAVASVLAGLRRVCTISTPSHVPARGHSRGLEPKRLPFDSTSRS
jgi:hypothetical protein